MCSPRKGFGLYWGEEGLKYFRVLVVVSVIALVQGNSRLFAQTPDALSQSEPAIEGEVSVIQLAERSIPIGETRGSDPSPSQGAASFFMILRMILVLALVAAAIYGIVFFLKRIARLPQPHDPHLKVLAGAHLGSNRFVHVVSVGSKAWLVGASEGGVSLIAEIVDSEAIDAMRLDESRKSTEEGTGKLPDFLGLLNRYRGGKELANGQGDLNAENVRKRRERLRGL
jgi:flagellar protein FliO/FliZ